METTREIGNIGEEIACKWLTQRDFLVVQRNYNKKWGEIDIIAIKQGVIQFFEVKSITVKSREGDRDRSPAENVHEPKVRRLKRVIQTYLLEKKYGLDAEFKFHVILVYMNSLTRRARVEFLENIIL